MNISAAIDILDGKVVRLTQGREDKKIIYSNDPITTAIKWEEEGADILHVVDLNAAFGNNDNRKLIKKIIQSVSIPVQVGGGIRSSEIFEECIEMGCSRIVVGTMAYKHPRLMHDICKSHPRRVVLSIDQVNGIIMIDGWKTSSGFSINEGIKKFRKIGVNCFLLTSIIHDGTLDGPDIEVLNNANSDRNIKNIASGGISNMTDLLRIRSLGCYGVILGKALYEEKIEMKRIKAIM